MTGGQPLQAEALPDIGTHERHFGNIEFQTLHVNSLIIFSQIRDKVNGRHAELQESIDNDDLDNPINIARMTADELVDYIQFTNNTWGAMMSLLDFADFQQADSRYNVVVAGHSRTTAIQAIAHNHTEVTGQPTNYTVLCKVEPSNSVGAIVSKQFTENIHAAVAIEREAMAIVEMYHYGLGSTWEDPEGFRKAYGNQITRQMLDKALTFGNLPHEVRSLVTSKHVPYAAAVELGKAAPIMRMRIAAENNLPLDLPLPAVYEQAVTYRLMGDAVHIYNNKLNSTAAKKYIEGFVRKMQDEISSLTGARKDDLFEDVIFDMPEFTMVSAGAQAQAAKRKEQARLARLLKEASNHPHQQTTDLLLTIAHNDNEGIFSAVLDDAAKAEADLASRMQRTIESLGQHSIDGLGDDFLIAG